MSTLSLTSQRWTVQTADPVRVDRLVAEHGLQSTLARCLSLRVSADGAADWLSPSITHLHDPMLMSGMPTALERIRHAIAEQQRVRIVTDYDVDGTTSSLILQSTLRLLGAKTTVDHHIPDRQDEGYGFSVRAAQAAIDDGVQLIITADIGVRDHAAVDTATRGGVDVIICDHHLPAGADVPEQALAVLCPPQAACDYPNPALAACGVSLKLAQALLADHPRQDAILRSMLKVAAIGTVADVVDLSTAENRAIVHLGVEQLRQGPHSPGLQALLDVSDVGDHLSSEDLGFRLGPRINAAGRLAQADAVLTLFGCRDTAQAQAQAKALDQLNRDRQDIQRKLVAESLARLADPPPDFAVLWGSEAEGWHRGVVGIVAAKVRDHIHRPAAIIAVSGEDARGSVRAPAGVHAVQALDSVADLLSAHGGHPAAAGFSTQAAHLPELARRLDEYVRTHSSDEQLVPELRIDAVCELGDLSADLAQDLARLAPFGKGNPAPLLLLNQVQVGQIRSMGERHLRMGFGPIEAVWWSGAGHRDILDQPCDFVGTLGFNHWRGRRTVRFTIKDVRPASQPSA
jgi:single-stranded-DNA-specific exonuclease